MVGLLAAVIDARETGVGRDVDTNLYDVALSMLTHHATWHLSAGIDTVRRPMSGHASVVPFQFFPTADGHIAIAAAKERFFRDLVAAIDLPELASDERFVDMRARSQNRGQLLPLLAARFAERTTADWLQRLRGVVPVSAVRSMEEALDVDDLQRRSMLAEYEHPRLGTVRAVAAPVFVSDFTPRYGAGPTLGADGPDVLAELGYGTREQDELRARGALGSIDPAAAGGPPGRGGV